MATERKRRRSPYCFVLSHAIQGLRLPCWRIDESLHSSCDLRSTLSLNANLIRRRHLPHVQCSEFGYCQDSIPRLLLSQIHARRSWFGTVKNLERSTCWTEVRNQFIKHTIVATSAPGSSDYLTTILKKDETEPDCAKFSSAGMLPRQDLLDADIIPSEGGAESAGHSSEAESAKGAQHARGLLLLNIVIFLWSSNFSVVKTAVATLTPSLFNLFRFAIAGVVLLPWAVTVRDWKLWVCGLELSFWLGLGYATQAVGLQYTSATHSAFISALQVIVVPLIAGLYGRKIGPYIWGSALLAFLGVGFIAYDGSLPNVGDLFNLVFALTCAAYVLRLEALAGKFPALALSAVQLTGLAIFMAVWVLIERPVFPPLSTVPWVAVTYLGLVTTSLTTWLETISLRDGVTASEAALIYSLEPAWASAFAFFYLGERFGERGVIGAVMVVFASVLSQQQGVQRFVSRWALRLRDAVMFLVPEGLLPAKKEVVVAVPRVHIENTASDMYTVVTVEAVDRAGLLGDLTKALRKVGLNVAKANVATVNGRIVDWFYVTDKSGAKLADASLPVLKTVLAKAATTKRRRPSEGAGAVGAGAGAMNGSDMDVSPPPSPGERIIEPYLEFELDTVRCHVDNVSCSLHSIITIVIADRVGLLSDMTRAMSNAGLEIHRADIETVDRVVHDVFHVTNTAGQKLTAEQCRQVVEELATEKLPLLPRFSFYQIQTARRASERRHKERSEADKGEGGASAGQ